MLTRKQLRLVLQLRGLSLEQIMQRTGIPNQSLMALIYGADNGGKDPSKLISAATYEKVLALLGLSPEFNGLRKNSVIEWRYQSKKTRGQEHSWREAAQLLRKHLMSDSLVLAEVTAKGGFLAGRKHLIFIYDPENEIRIVVSGIDKSGRAFMEEAFGTSIERTEVVTLEEFNFMATLIGNDVLRLSQFNVVMTGKALKYDWKDVQAAAKEFNFTTEDIINLIVDAVRTPAASTQSEQLPAADSVTLFRRTG